MQKENELKHQSVMLQEIVAGLRPQAGDIFIDATVGGGGHSLALATKIGVTGCLIGFDLDRDTLNRAREVLKNYLGQLYLFHANFKNMNYFLADLAIGQVDGILFDLGLSTYLLEDRNRGFSFMKDGPLDMRLDSSFTTTAAEIINRSSQGDLENIFRTYGEEPRSKHYARIIASHSRKTKIESTRQLWQLIRENTRSQWQRKMKIDPATRIFQALRIAVNQELDNLKAALPIAVDILRPGKRLAVISFHSLEDGITKRYFQQEAKDCLCPPSLPICGCNHKKKVKIITRKPLRPTPQEINQNRRARSACLRIVERLPLN
ncbi:16S rRNA (cytosine(1402)-N(4))-methyltransferase RsmH [candidate division CSSED10-310 bacterium]|uniref:Ribosomal RNA small subunit methyltransferase H n=1 Tax=candidate division CSSED10-310 bacterium TaxID=2855610 RepID=A0ABV6YV40_UNCC1